MEAPPLFARIFDFSLAVLWNWNSVVAVVFLVPALLALLPVNARQKISAIIPSERRRRFLITVCFLSLFLSSFEAYDDVNLKLNAAQTALQQLQHREAAKRELEHFYVSIGEMLDNNLPRDISDEEFQKYRDEVNSRVNAAAQWISKNMGDGARARFLDHSGLQAAFVPRAVNKVHNQIILELTRMKQNLKEMIESPAWDR